MTQVFVIGNADLSSIENVSISDDIRHRSIAILETRRKRDSHNIVESSKGKAINSSNLANSLVNHVLKSNSQNDGRIQDEETHNVEVTESPNLLYEKSDHDIEDEREKNTQISLSDEKKLHQEQASKREEIFKNIILNEQVKFSWEVNVK